MPRSCLKLPAPQEIVNEIERRAKKIGLNLVVVLAQAGVPGQTVKNWLDGSGAPSFRIIEKLDDAIQFLEAIHKKK